MPGAGLSPEAAPRRASVAPPPSGLAVPLSGLGGDGSFRGTAEASVRGAPKRTSLKRRGSVRPPAAPPPPSPPPPEPPLYKLTAAQLRECEKVFHASGGVRPDNLSRILSQLNIQSHAAAVEHYWKERLASGAPHAGYLKFQEFVDLVTDMLIQRVYRGSQRDAAALEAFVAMGGGRDGEGTVDAATLRDACQFFALGVDLDKLTAADASGQLSFARFKALLEEDIEPGVKEAFLRFGGKDNADGIYEIPTEVLVARSIEAGMDEGEVIRFVNTVDSDASGTIEMAEFQALLRGVGINPGDMNSRTLPELAALRWGGERAAARSKVASSEKGRGDAARSRAPTSQPAAAPGGSGGTQSQMQWGYLPQSAPASEIEAILQRLGHMPSPDVALPPRNVSPLRRQSRHGAEMAAGKPAAGRVRMIFKPPRPPLRVPLSRSPSPDCSPASSTASPAASRQPADARSSPRPATGQRHKQRKPRSRRAHERPSAATMPAIDAALAAKLFQVRAESRQRSKRPPPPQAAAPVDPRFQPGDLVIVEPPPGAAESQPADSDAPPPGTRMVVVGPGDAPGTVAVQPEAAAAAEGGAHSSGGSGAECGVAGEDGERGQAESAPEGGAAEAAKGVRSIATSHLRHAGPDEKDGAAGAGDGAATGKGGFEGLCLRILLKPQRDPWERAGTAPLLPPLPPKPPAGRAPRLRRSLSQTCPYRAPPVPLPDPMAATAPPRRGRVAPAGEDGAGRAAQREARTVPYKQYSDVVRQNRNLRERIAWLEEREKQHDKEQAEKRRLAAKAEETRKAAARMRAEREAAAAAQAAVAEKEEARPQRTTPPKKKPAPKRVPASGGPAPSRTPSPRKSPARTSPSPWGSTSPSGSPAPRNTPSPKPAPKKPTPKRPKPAPKASSPTGASAEPAAEQQPAEEPAAAPAAAPEQPAADQSSENPARPPTADADPDPLANAGGGWQPGEGSTAAEKPQGKAGARGGKGKAGGSAGGKAGRRRSAAQAVRGSAKRGVQEQSADGASTAAGDSSSDNELNQRGPVPKARGRRRSDGQALRGAAAAEKNKGKQKKNAAGGEREQTVEDGAGESSDQSQQDKQGGKSKKRKKGKKKNDPSGETEQNGEDGAGQPKKDKDNSPRKRAGGKKSGKGKGEGKAEGQGAAAVPAADCEPQPPAGFGS
eukprot:TRINITY_DN245_c0_g1_i1.p1 TRINITY_DN245_c0_g1~~TRINITY_DN245_c0_g1_i1.p1  ORF type:complete len:1172 (+),score=249.46 TRINITY_DN245_c0_g1_i1:100-3615(+)